VRKPKHIHEAKLAKGQLPQTRPALLARIKEIKQAHAAAEVIRYGFSQTSVGTILVAESVNGTVAIAIREHPDEDALLSTVRARFPHAVLRHDRTGTRKAVEAVVGFVEGPRRNIPLPLDIRGTEFQRRVWAAVMKIPFAKTTNFAEIARNVGSPRAVRAVGNACSQNPLEFAIPCHRVLRSDGSYSGGSTWGDRRQSTVLRREAQWSASMGAKRDARRAAKG
jgi:AraC family transcriptional regulator of adaptative response/methylated-DNA-[protein]-cysteine methyltransferase